MKNFIEALNHPAIAFEKKHKGVSLGLVMVTVLVNSVLEPVIPTE